MYHFSVKGSGGGGGESKQGLSLLFLKVAIDTEFYSRGLHTLAIYGEAGVTMMSSL